MKKELHYYRRTYISTGQQKKFFISSTYTLKEEGENF